MDPDGQALLYYKILAGIVDLSNLRNRGMPTKGWEKYQRCVSSLNLILFDWIMVVFDLDFEVGQRLEIAFCMTMIKIGKHFLFYMSISILE